MNSGRNILFSAITMFAFLWVIIGDLVAMHINVIYNVDVYNVQPYAKTKKSDEKCLKLKKGESFDGSFFVDLMFLDVKDFYVNYSDYTEINFVKELNFNIYHVIINSSGRSPPTSFS